MYIELCVQRECSLYIKDDDQEQKRIKQLKLL
jgi:hypothetical protein